jgi:hypothetical protein
VHRLAARPPPGAPELTRLPEAWWAASPEVRVRRLGLRLQLDLLDNLQRALYATGTYEPALLRFLGQELRRGDVVVDVGARVQVVAVTTFDAWAAEARIGRLDLVKLDVEGAELEALRGMAASLGRLRPRAVVIEVKDRVLERAGVGGEAVRALLERVGYQPTGQILPVANQVYRPRATTRPPVPSTR